MLDLSWTLIDTPHNDKYWGFGGGEGHLVLTKEVPAFLKEF